MLASSWLLVAGRTPHLMQHSRLASGSSAGAGARKATNIIAAGN
jgi:hypothetical protein